MKRLRVLISSHEFSPDQGSECAVGWNIATRMAEYHDVTVLCADGPALYSNSYRDAVTRYFGRNGAIPGLRVIFVEQPPETLRLARLNRKLMSFTKGVGWQPLYYLGLDHWHRATLRKALELGLHNFDAVHQLTPISFLRPGYLWTTGVPFFWGPLGGMCKVPRVYARSGGINSLIFETLRSVNIDRQLRASRFRDTVRAAKRIWTVSDDERGIVNSLVAGKALPMLDTAPPKAIAGRLRNWDATTPLRLCWSGRHDARKALPLLLQALARLPEPQLVTLDVLGTGNETGSWQELARQLSLSGISWHGNLPYHEALKTMDRADVLVHTSYKEAASMVVLEALGWGMPVICHDACGMALAIEESCGIKIPFVDPKRSIEGFRDAIERLLRNPELVGRLSEGALRRASALSWEAKVKEFAEAYGKFVS
ncbi:MAG: hypothetical protein A2075_11555 [Geobacteraceae bacterium GWC2_58_44]|nr:MAG: hypothetical protein A2075_11555 [Geobacteraceae bacterium GWC2_58_44]HBG04814.1 hypothetical protein [Geobacter sp.]